MVKPTSFNVEDAECLLRQLDQFRGALQQEWGKVSTQWENLKSTWCDQQFDKFAPLFEKLSSTYQNEIDDCENYMYFLIQHIETAQQRKVKLGDVVEKVVMGVQTVQGIVGLGYASPPPEISLSSAELISSIEQREEHKTDSDFARIDRVPNIEDQLAESFHNSQENKRKKRQEELEKSHHPQNSHNKSK